MILLEQVLLAIIFLLIFFISVVPPGFLIIQKSKVNLDNLEKLTVAAVLGLIIFTLFAYAFSWLHLRFLMYLFPVIGVFTLLKFNKSLLSLKFNISHKLFFSAVFCVVLSLFPQSCVRFLWDASLPYLWPPLFFRNNSFVQISGMSSRCNLKKPLPHLP